MKITKKLMSVVLAAIMMIGAFALSVSAESIYDTAVDLPSGEKLSFTLSSTKSKDYKVILSQKGTLTLNIDANIQRLYVYLYDSDGNSIDCNEYNFTSGEGDLYSRSGYLNCKWNSTTEKIKGTLKYELKKGTYYIRLSRIAYTSGNGKTTLKATYGSDDESNAKISYLTLQMEVGDTLRLGAVTEPADADVTWSSSKSKVATVSASGKVTAKKEGSTIITAKSGSSKVKIKIIVV